MGFRIPLLVMLLLFPVFGMAAGLQFSLTDLAGKTFTFANFKGKWLVVNYWATWCPPCLDEIPELIEFHEAHSGKDAVVLGVNFEDVEKDELKSFIDEYFISYPVFKAELKRDTPFGSIIGLPTTFVVSPEGKVTQTKIGGVTRQWLESVITQKKTIQ